MKSLVPLAGILSESDQAEVSQLQSELLENWSKRQIWRTQTEMEVSVLNDHKHPTRASKYWQCIREQAVFFENLIALSFRYRRNEIKIKKTRCKLERKTGFKREKLEVDLDELLFLRTQMETEGKDRVRELKLWSQIMKSLDDGSFDKTNPNSHQAETFSLRFRNQVEALTPGSSAGEAFNAIGLFQTSQRLNREKNGT